MDEAFITILMKHGYLWFFLVRSEIKHGTKLCFTHNTKPSTLHVHIQVYAKALDTALLSLSD